MNTQFRSRLLLLVPLLLSPLYPQASAPFDEVYAYELMRYLYRWHLDDAFFQVPLEKLDAVEIFYRDRTPDNLDEGDNSSFLEVIIPVVNLEVKLKKSDYEIEELGLRVRGEQYKVIAVQHYRQIDWDLGAYTRLSYDFEAMFTYLYETRNQQDFPSDYARAQLREEAIKALVREGYMDPDNPLTDEQVGYLAPISMVSNELWYYWINGHMLLHFSSDIDFENEAYWEIAQVNVEIIELRNEVIVDSAERVGTGYMTKDFAGRVLFNCIVHGMEYRSTAGQTPSN